MASRQELTEEVEAIRRRLASTPNPSEREHLRRRYEEIRQILAENSQSAFPSAPQVPPLTSAPKPTGQHTSGRDWRKILFSEIGGKNRIFLPVDYPTSQKSPPPKKYPTLRTIASLLVVYAWLMIIGVCFAAYTIVKEHPEQLWSTVWVVLGIFSLTLVVFGFAELLRLAVDVEENTRRAAEAAEKNQPKETEIA